MIDRMAAHASEATHMVVNSRALAEGYVAKVCFKTGPPRLVGIELEWTVHYAGQLDRPLDPPDLIAALGEHAPPALSPQSPHIPLPRGGVVTVEPGGQVEISTQPRDSLGDLLADATIDIDHLVALLARSGLILGSLGRDHIRPPRRIVDSPRYAAMEHAFDRIGPHGRDMMASTAGLQVCLDAGEPDQLAARWQALHLLGPVLLALFANSPADGWASSRMRTWRGVDPQRSRPPETLADPRGQWARRALDTPLLCVRRPSGDWTAPAGMTFAEWIGAPGNAPTYGDLDYHLTTLFPPVRPHGYFEVRYLDTQPGDEWRTPVAIMTALFARAATVDTVLDLAAPAADRWMPAAQLGLADPIIAMVAPAIADLGCRALSDTDLPPDVTAAVTDSVHARLYRERTVR
jgi:glutamate--cysteine ligase